VLRGLKIWVLFLYTTSFGGAEWEREFKPSLNAGVWFGRAALVFPRQSSFQFPKGLILFALILFTKRACNWN
jgi:hypothetical protein